MSGWERVSGPATNNDGWERVNPETISKQEFSGPDKDSYDSPIQKGLDWLLQPGNEGADFKTRLLASIKTTPKGKREFLEQRYGKGNVEMRPVYSQEFADPTASQQAGFQSPALTGYQIQFREQDGQWKPLDDKQFTPRDFADWGGAAIDIAPNIASSFVPGGQSIPGQMAATAAGRGLRQGISAMIPGDDYKNPALEVPLDVAGQTALTGGIGLGFKGLGGAYDFIRNAPTRSYLERTGKGIPEGSGAAGFSFRPSPIDPVSQGRVEAFERTGIQPSFAQATHSKMYQSAEKAGATGISGAQRAFDFYNKEAGKAVSSLDDVINGIGSKIDTDVAAHRIGAAYEKSRNAIVASRKMQWDTAYNEANRLTGGKPFISLPGYVDALKSELAEKSALASGTRKTIVSQVEDDLRAVANPVFKGKTIVDWVPKNIRAVDVKQLHNRLASGSFVEGVESASTAQAVSGKLKSALDTDVDNFVGLSGGKQEAVNLLKQAWSNWGDASAKLDKITKTTIGKSLKTQDTVGIADETIVDRALRLKPSELRSFLSVLRKSDPDMYTKFPQLVLQNAKDKAKISPSGTTMEAPNFSMEKFMSSMPKDEGVWKMIFRNPELRQKVADTQTVFRTYIESAGHGAPRELSTEIRTAAGNIGGAMDKGGGSFVFVMRQMADLLGGGAISRKMFSPKGVQELMTISRTQGKTVAIETVLANIAKEIKQNPKEQEIFPVPPMSDYEQ